MDDPYWKLPEYLAKKDADGWEEELHQLARNIVADATPAPKAEPETIKLLGNRVMLLRVEENFAYDGLLLIPDPYKHGQIMFHVLQAGPGEWAKNPRTKKTKFIKPEVEKGDCVISRHWLDAENPGCRLWHKPEYLDDQGGSGRVIVDARFCLAKWKPGQTQPQETVNL